MTASFSFIFLKGVRPMPGYQKKNKEEYDQKTANLTPEEQEMRKENLEARDRFGTDD